MELSHANIAPIFPVFPPIATAFPRVGDPKQQRACALLHHITLQTGLSITEIARAAGLSPSTLTRIYPTPSVSYTLSTRTLTKIHAAFPDAYPGSSAVEVSSEPRENEIQLYLLSDVDVPYPELNIPAPVGFDFYSMSPDEAKTQALPNFSMHDADRYAAAYMPGDAMAPRIRAGEMLIIDKMKPAASGSDVFVSLRQENRGQVVAVATLVERGRDQITLQQGNRLVKIHQSLVKKMCSIVAMIRS